MNRKQRRKAAQNHDSQPQEFLTQESLDYILQRPEQTSPSGKTLLERANERQAELNIQKHPLVHPQPDLDDEDEPSAALIALLYGTTLTMVHFTLDVLVYNQYAQLIEWNEIARRIGVALPAFICIVYVLRMQPLVSFIWTRQILLLGSASFAGCYLVYLGNDEPYMAVMKRAPPLGTIWLWLFIEMRKRCEVINLGVVVVYCLWNGFTVF